MTDTDIPSLIERGAQALQRRNGFVPWEKVIEPAREAYRKDVLAVLEESGALSRLNDFTDPKMPGMVSVGLLNTERETCERIRSDNDRLRARIRELESEIIRLAEPPNPPLTMNDALALLNAQAREIERLKAAAVPLCIGRPLIGILAKEGAWSSSDGRCVVAADDLLGADPYDQIDKLRETLEIPAPSPPCMMPDGGECCPQYHAAVIRIAKLEAENAKLQQFNCQLLRDDPADNRISELRETLAGMHCPRQINAGTIAECTGRNQCRCSAGAVFVKTGAAQK